MFTLKLLGGANLDGPDGPLTGRVAQRRRLAVLALLAMNRRQGLAREKLAAMLWPESDGDRARHLLSDTVYVINRALGGELITAAGDELRLSADRLTCDAREFEDAVDRGALDDAVRLYAGPFMDGFFVEGSEEFERWVSAERERLQNLHARALEHLAVEKSTRGDVRGAIECWRRLTSDDQFNSRLACSMAEALDHGGDRAGALQHLEDHTSTLQKDLGIAPPVEVTTMVRRLRTPRTSADPPSVGSPIPETPSTLSHREPASVEEALPTRARLRPLTILGAAAAILLAIVVARTYRPLATTSTEALTATSLQSVAVLPFADLSPARDHEYFSDGVAEELSTRLARVPGLKVAARTSAFAFKGTDTDVKAIGLALNVDALVEGSVREADGQVRVAVRLVNARDGYQIWAETWDRNARDVLALQDDIATAVVRALRPGAVAPSPGSARTVDLQAYDLYLQGRYLWHQRTAGSLKRAADLFERAVALAPEYAEAHSGVADAYAVLGFYDHLPPRDAFPRAKAAARRALAIDDRLAQAHASLGYVALYYDWQWPEAERSLKRAIELNPNYSVGHQWLANYFVARGRFDEAVAAMRRAQETDPLSLIASAALGWIHYYRRDFDAAVQQCRRTIELNAGFEQAWLWGGQALEAAGRYAEAVTMLERAAAISKRSAVTLTALGRAHALAGDRAAARRIVDELQRDHANYLPAYEMAKLHLALGQRAEALKLLQRAYDQRSHSLVFLAVDPQLDPLQSDAQFGELLAKTGAAAPR
jgi:TolB-like protein/DNA-binding SARP family transcriptional activator/Flp pilus assembly protein TadD